MKPNYLLHPLHFSALALSGTILSQANPALSQLTPDNTLGAESSTVNPRNDNSESIQGGAIRGQNLFHSFQEFNVDANRGVYFANPDAVSNIFSRVTGSNPSNILGTLGVDGTADLYLVNPNGIVFGENSSLDVQGSFMATTADAVEFGNGGLFSAVAPRESLLTISAPLGLQFGSTPGSIINRSFARDETGEFVGLQVPTGENLTLVGGEIRFEAGQATSKGGNINIGGLDAAGTVGINNDGSLSFPDDVERADMTFTNAADIDVRGMGGGNININAGNMRIEAKESNQSQIKAGILPVSTSPDAQAGDITIDVVENITVDNSLIANQVSREGVGNSGNIVINTNSLELINNGDIDATILGQGFGGKIDIAASEDIVIDSGNMEGVRSTISSLLDTNAKGSAGITISATNLNLINSGVIITGSRSQANSGNVTIFATNLTFAAGGQIIADSFGQGGAGTIDITATDNFTIDHMNLENGVTGVSSITGFNATKDSGGIKISTNNLNLANGGILSASTFGQGNAGVIDIAATGNVIVDGQSSSIDSVVDSDAIGNSGGIKISTTNLNLANGGVVDTSTSGQGNAGVIDIAATGNILVDGEGSGINSVVNLDAIGDSGGIKISANSLNLANGGVVDSSTFGQGDAGVIEIVATGNVLIEGEGSGINSAVSSVAIGDSGGIKISANSVNLTNGSKVNASTLGQGDAGKVTISSSNLNLTDAGVILAVTFGQGDAGEINVFTSDLNLSAGGTVSTSAGDRGNGGTININSTESITIDGDSSGIFSVVFPDAIGNSGEIKLFTTDLSLTNGGVVFTSTSGEGNGGAIDIVATENILLRGVNSIEELVLTGISSGVTEDGLGDAGKVTISTTNLNLIEAGVINTGTSGEGNAGEVRIKADFVNISRGSAIFSNSQTSFNAEDITLNVANYLQLTDSEISTSSTQSSGGNLTITADDIELRGNSAFTTNIASGEGSGGNITINADSVLAFDDSDIFAFAADGKGGNITLNTPAFFAENFTLNSLTANPDSLSNNARADINATGAVSGAVTIPDVSFIQNGLTELANDSIDTNELVANSCVVPAGERSQGKFLITGSESLPIRPGNNLPSKYPTGQVRGAVEDNSSWQPGDPIVEAQDAYRLANGKWVLSRECS